jgi:hypothetical protein
MPDVRNGCRDHRSGAATGVDPYILVGVLIEGAVHVLAAHLPEEKKLAAGLAKRMLWDRMTALGVVIERLPPHRLRAAFPREPAASPPGRKSSA